MTRSPSTVALAVLLAAAAGHVDAMGYLFLRGFFVSFMSGNSTRLGVGAAAGVAGDAVTAGLLIATFVAGAMAGAVVVRLAPPPRRRAAVLVVDALLLFGAVALHRLGIDRGAVAAMALAMGVENAVFIERGVVTTGLTYMTGALVRVGHGLVAALFGEGGRLAWLPDALLWAGLVGGATTGAALFPLFGLDALAVPAAAVLLAALWTVADPRTA